MMLSDAHPGDLPHPDGRASLVRDVSSFEAIAEGVNVIFNSCGKRDHVPGWAVIGKLYNCFHSARECLISELAVANHLVIPKASDRVWL